MAVRHSLLALAAVMSVASAQTPPAPDAKAKESRLSERQAERVAQQERLIACNREAREKQMRGAMRQQFTRDCLKGDSAAAGGGHQK